MDFIKKFILPYKYYLLSVILIAGVFIWPNVEKALKVDNSLSIWFLEDDPALLEYQEYKEEFGNDESLILLVKDSDGVLTSEYFKDFIRLSDSLESIPEVEGVVGPGNFKLPAQSLLGPTTKDLLKTNSDPKDVLKDLEEFPYVRKQFFTSNYKAARFMVVFEALPDFDKHRERLINEVKKKTSAIFPTQKVHFGGVGVIFSGLNELSQKDFGFFLGLGYLLMFLIILVVYRSFVVLVYALSTIFLSTYFCLGFYGMFGHQLNLMSTLIPSILILLGILDIIHILNQHQNHTNIKNRNSEEKTLISFKAVWRPILYTSLTTMAGFLSLLSSPMAILSNFGIFSAIGIFLCFLFALFLGLIFLPLIKQNKSESWANPIILALHNFIFAKKTGIVLLSLILVALCGIGISKLKNDTYTLGYFPEDHQVVQDHRTIENTWGAYIPFEFMLKPKEGYTLYSPEIVRAGLNFSDSIQKLKGIGSSFGFVDLYEAGLKNRFKEHAEKMLNRKSGLSEVDKFLKIWYPQLSNYYMNESGIGRITVFGAMSSAEELDRKKQMMLNIAETEFKSLAVVTPAGYLPMYSEIVRYAAESQIYSLALAFILVFLLVWIFIRKLKLAVLAIIPNIFPVLLILGIMGWFDINLDIATASISAIVLSFCIDDTIHFLYQYQEQRKLGTTSKEAGEYSFSKVGAAIVLTSLILFFGYAFMLFASLKTVILFGLLTIIGVIGALFSHLMLLPILLEQFNRD